MGEHSNLKARPPSDWWTRHAIPDPPISIGNHEVVRIMRFLSIA